MADALSDLRYISRMGYRDPWAEATKTIANSLLSYGQSKLKRDTLLASIEKDDAARAERNAREQVQSDRFAYSQLDKPEDKKFFITENPERALRIFGTELAVSSNIESATKEIDYKSKLSSLSNEYLNPKNSYSVRLSNMNDALELSTSNKDTAKSQSLRTQITNLKNNHNLSEKTKYIQQFADEGVREGWLQEGDKSRIDDALSNQTTAIAETILNRSYTQNASNMRSLETRYNLEKKSVLDIFGPDEDGFTENPEEFNRQLNNLDNTYRKYLPPQWRNEKRPMEDIFRDIDLGGSPTRVQNKGTETETETETGTGTGTGTKITPVANSNILSVDPAQQLFSPNSKVMIINPATGSEQLVSGSVYNNIKDNVGVKISQSKNSAMKSYVPLDVSRESSLSISRGPGDVRRINEVLSFKKQDNTQSSIPLQSGSEVINIKTGKRHRVIVKPLDVTKKTKFAGSGFVNLSIEQPYKYVVEGKSYSLEQFKERFGVPIFSEMKTDTTTNTGFSVQRLTPSSVTQIQ